MKASTIVFLTLAVAVGVAGLVAPAAQEVRTGQGFDAVTAFFGILTLGTFIPVPPTHTTGDKKERFVAVASAACLAVGGVVGAFVLFGPPAVGLAIGAAGAGLLSSIYFATR